MKKNNWLNTYNNGGNIDNNIPKWAYNVKDSMNESERGFPNWWLSTKELNPQRKQQHFNAIINDIIDSGYTLDEIPSFLNDIVGYGENERNLVDILPVIGFDQGDLKNLMTNYNPNNFKNGGEINDNVMKMKKGGYLKDKNTYVTKEGKETKRGLWANVYLKNHKYPGGGYLDYQSDYKGFGVGPMLYQDNSYYRSVVPATIENMDAQINRPTAFGQINDVLGAVNQGIGQVTGLLGSLPTKQMGQMPIINQSVANNLTQDTNALQGVLDTQNILPNLPSSPMSNFMWGKKESGGYVSRYQDGGMTSIKKYSNIPQEFVNGGVQPYITNNPNDPRIKKYADSLSLYNKSKVGEKYWKEALLTKPIVKITPQMSVFERMIARLENDTYGNDLGLVKNAPKSRFLENNNLVQDYNMTAEGKFKKPIKPEYYHKYETGYRTSPSSDEERLDDKKNYYYVANYKKPVQPVIYKKPKQKIPIPIEKDNITQNISVEQTPTIEQQPAIIQTQPPTQLLPQNNFYQYLQPRGWSRPGQSGEIQSQSFYDSNGKMTGEIINGQYVPTEYGKFLESGMTEDEYLNQNFADGGKINNDMKKKLKKYSAGGYLMQYQDGGMTIGYPEYLHPSNVTFKHEIPVPKVHFTEDTSGFDMGVNLNDLVQMNGGGIGKYPYGGYMTQPITFNTNSNRMGLNALQSATSNDFMHTKVRHDRQKFADDKVDWGFMNWAKEPTGFLTGVLGEVPIVGDVVNNALGDSFLTRTSGHAIGKGVGDVGIGTAKIVGGIGTGNIGLIGSGIGNVGEGVGSTVGTLSAENAMSDYNKAGYISGKRTAKAGQDFSNMFNTASSLYGNVAGGLNSLQNIGGLGQIGQTLSGGQTGLKGFGTAMGNIFGMPFQNGGLISPEVFEYKYGGLTPRKAREILHDKSVHGHPLTDKQRKYFGYISSQKKSQGGWIDTL